MNDNPGATPANAGAEMPVVDVPSGDVPIVDVPSGDVPIVDVPSGDVPIVDVPSADAPPADVPPSDAPGAEVPQAAIPQVTATNVTVSYESEAASTDQPGEAADGVPPVATPRKRSFKWLWRVLIGLLIAGLIALSVYMIMVTNGWRDYSSDLEASLNDVKATAASSQADLEATQARLDTVQTQLDTANARITDLANEEANATDNQDALRNHMEAMIQCADERQKLIDVLTNSNLVWTDGRTDAQVERELTQYCDAVKSDYQTYLAGN